MPKLYACIISPEARRDRSALIGTARQFSYSIELLDDGILFDVSGLERLVGKPERIAKNILAELKRTNTPGSVAVAQTVDTAILLARQKTAQSSRFSASEEKQSEACTLNTPDMFAQLPLRDLDIEQDTLNVFNELGLHRVEDLLAIPHDDLVNRYGREFESVIKTIQQKGDRLIMPNVKESRVSWGYELDLAVEDFEQLIFILNHGLEILFDQIAHYGLSTEQLDISFKLSNKMERCYEIKTSFPTLERPFWLKLINLRVSLAPPEAAITSMNVTAYFTKPRPSQRGLYTVSRPEPESLLLTVNKIKKLVGEENVGVPVILNQRLAEGFTLDADAMPEGKTRNNKDRISSRLCRSICGEACSTGQPASNSTAMPPRPAEQIGGTAAKISLEATEKQSFSANRAAEPLVSVKPHISQNHGIVAFSYFRPPVLAEVLVRDGRLVFIKTRYFSGHVVEYSGVWRANSKWWDTPWKMQEWDVEVEDHGVYRLCKEGQEWFITGEYD